MRSSVFQKVWKDLSSIIIQKNNQADHEGYDSYGDRVLYSLLSNL